MRINRDLIMEALDFDCGNKPTSHFYTVNSLYGADYGIDDSTVEVNHYSQDYLNLQLVSVPTLGVYRFFVHSGLNYARFTPCDTMPESKLLERFGKRSDDTLKLACTKYQVIGTYLIVSDDTISVYA